MTRPNIDQPDGRGTHARGRGHRRWQILLLLVIVVGGVPVIGTFAGSTLRDSLTTLAHLNWPWLLLALIAEAGSMAAFARTQRRLLRVSGTKLDLGSVMAVTYAGNAISVSLPLAGSEMATAFSFRQFNRHGIDAAVAGWALAVSGIISSLAFAVVLTGGAFASGGATAALVGVSGALVSLLPAVAVIAALRYRSIRHALNRILARLFGLSRRLVNRPSPDADGALERFLERITSIRLPRLQYAEVFGLALWNWVADCLCLAAAIRATGAAVPWQGLFLAYTAGMTAASVGLTPGGVGIIEAALAAALVGAGLKAHHALAAVLAYRVVSFWLVMTVGWIVMFLVTRRADDRATPVAEST
jgi:uncharacterized protein (TIRG00374 family)